MLSGVLLLSYRPVHFMHINRMAVIHAIHNDMRMTFSKHFPFLFLFSAAFLTLNIQSDG